MQNVLNIKDLEKLSNGDIVEGICLVQSYNILPTKNGSKYVAGTLQAKGSIPFKIWSNYNPESPYSNIVSNKIDFNNKACSIYGKVDRYGGGLSIIIEDMDIVECDDSSIFFEEKYNKEACTKELYAILKKEMSEDAYGVFDKMFKPVYERFSTEFCAVSHHDNCKGGLLAHTLKLVKMASLLKMYSNLRDKIPNDLLYMSIVFHDVGKISEYNNGTISDIGKKLSHHTMGVLYISQYGDLIRSTLGEEFYYNLLAVIEQHHGEYEERPRIVVSYIVHLLDCLESNLTSVDKLVEDSNGGQINYVGFKLN